MLTTRKTKWSAHHTNVCVSICGENHDALMKEVSQLPLADIDLVEWRIDYFSDWQETTTVVKTLKHLRDVLKETPLLVTCRTKDEGGQLDLSETAYFDLYQDIITTEFVDMIDIEWRHQGGFKASRLKNVLEVYSTPFIWSYHDTEKTGNYEELVSLLKEMKDLGGDIYKLAVTPTTSQDVLTLLQVLMTMSVTFPETLVCGISMGELGKLTRISGEIIPSCLTFAKGVQSSAPGQLTVQQVKETLHLLKPREAHTK